MRDHDPQVSLEGAFELADERLFRRMTSGFCGSQTRSFIELKPPYFFEGKLMDNSLTTPKYDNATTVRTSSPD
jgi:hypothetical protein